jgi:hypothetical protein
LSEIFLRTAPPTERRLKKPVKAHKHSTWKGG